MVRIRNTRTVACAKVDFPGIKSRPIPQDAPKLLFACSRNRLCVVVPNRFSTWFAAAHVLSFRSASSRSIRDCIGIPITCKSYTSSPSAQTLRPYTVCSSGRRTLHTCGNPARLAPCNMIGKPARRCAPQQPSPRIARQSDSSIVLWELGTPSHHPSPPAADHSVRRSFHQRAPDDARNVHGGCAIIMSQPWPSTSDRMPQLRKASRFLSSDDQTACRTQCVQPGREWRPPCRTRAAETTESPRGRRSTAVRSCGVPAVRSTARSAFRTADLAKPHHASPASGHRRVPCSVALQLATVDRPAKPGPGRTGQARR